MRWPARADNLVVVGRSLIRLLILTVRGWELELCRGVGRGVVVIGLRRELVARINGVVSSRARPVPVTVNYGTLINNIVNYNR